jgi:excisionase family DNA binding protein
MAANVKHLVPLEHNESSEPEWSKELKQILGQLVDLAATMLSAHQVSFSLENVVTAEELADRLRLPKSTILELARTRKLPAFRVGKHVRFDLDVLRKALTLPAELGEDEKPKRRF